MLTHKDTSGLFSAYICYSKPVDGGAVTALDRAEVQKNSLINRQTLFQQMTFLRAPFILAVA